MTYSRCLNCKMVYCETIWDDDLLRNVYEKVIDHRKSRAGTLSIATRIWRLEIWANILRILFLSGRKELANLKLIDYGCGWGDFLDVVNGYGIDVIGYEVDRIKIEHLRERGHPVAVEIAELKSFGPFDVFVMLSVLEHLQDPGSALRLAKELLKPNGLLVLSVMDYRSKYIEKNARRLRRGLPPLTRNLNPVEHVNVFDYNSLMSLLKRYDFKLIATGLSLRATNLPGMRNRMSFIRCVNVVERFAAKIVRQKELPITAYSANVKQAAMGLFHVRKSLCGKSSR